jgi:hypothetical protein
MTAFTQFAGRLGGYPFVKVVVDRPGTSTPSTTRGPRSTPTNRRLRPDGGVAWLIRLARRRTDRVPVG